MIPPEAFAKFFLLVCALAAAFGMAAFAFVPRALLLPSLTAVFLLLAAPLLALSYQAQARRRAVDGELPFFAKLLFIMSYRPFADLSETFEARGCRARATGRLHR